MYIIDRVSKKKFFSFFRDVFEDFLAVYTKSYNTLGLNKDVARTSLLIYYEVERLLIAQN
jgi:hypothetical protein